MHLERVVTVVRAVFLREFPPRGESIHMIIAEGNRGGHAMVDGAPMCISEGAVSSYCRSMCDFLI